VPEMLQLKKFPYQTEKRCETCHPASMSDPPFYECVAERAFVGTQYVRDLECPNCGSRSTDVFSPLTNQVVFDHAMDTRAAKGR
jgi:hypothetical protein